MQQSTSVDFQQTNAKSKISPALRYECPIRPEIQMTNIQPQRECGQVMATCAP